jgi:hypothetical protein
MPLDDGLFNTLETDFDRRWAGWVARGRSHERRVRARLTFFLGVLLISLALFYTFVW